MFEDCRGKKVIFLAHCLLNQNAKLDRCAHHKGAVRELVEILLDHEIGIVQIDCPEMLFLGLDRKADAAALSTVESEDTRIAERMTESAAQGVIQIVTKNTVQQIVDYKRHGFAVLGVLGINGSPTCGVETTWRCGEELEGHGELISSICKQLANCNEKVAMRGVKSKEVSHAVQTTLEMVRA